MPDWINATVQTTNNVINTKNKMLSKMVGLSFIIYSQRGYTAILYDLFCLGKPLNYGIKKECHICSRKYQIHPTRSIEAIFKCPFRYDCTQYRNE